MSLVAISLSREATRVRSLASRAWNSGWQRYAFAVLAGGGAVAIKLALSPLLTRDEPVLLFLGATLLAGTVGGLGPGLVVTVIGTLCDEYFFMAPYGTWHLNSPDQVLRLALFGVEGVIISVICARTRSARRQAEISAADAVELQQRVTQIADHERRRLSHDLHDGLGQQLTGIALLTRRLQERLSTSHAGETADAGALTAMVRDALRWAHDLCGTLDPTMSGSAGIAEALADLAAKASGLLRVECRFEEWGGATEISPEEAIQLYRIAQEAISNAARHGRAKCIVIRLEQRDEMILLQISDNGVGVRPGHAVRSDGMGLRIMRYRAQILGGSVTVGPGPDGCGTRVECRCPLASPARFDPGEECER
jgi:signal transduction histidine kinase